MGFMKRHSDYHVNCNYTSAKLTQLDGRARGDDVIGNLTVSKLLASRYVSLPLLRRFIKPAPDCKLGKRFLPPCVVFVQSSKPRRVIGRTNKKWCHLVQLYILYINCVYKVFCI